MAKGKAAGKGKFSLRDLAGFAFTLGTMQKSGVPILDCMEICAQSSGDKKLAGAIREASSSIREGEGIATPLKKAGFPPMMVQMVAAGEETGKLDDMLIKIADYYEEEILGRRPDELTETIQQMGTMVSAGLPLAQTVGICAENHGGKMGETLESVRADLVAGGNLSGAMAKHPKVFPPLVVNMVKAGEMGGNLDAILERIAEYRVRMARMAGGKRG